MALGSFRPLASFSSLCSSPSPYARICIRATAKDKPPAVADRRFLWACCANTTNASVCYDSLLPSAGSFHGNRVRVARAVAVVAFARLRGFYDELRRLRLRPGGTGAGRVAESALRSCATFADESLGREGDLLAMLQTVI